jgi:hypothetical protein
LLPSTTTPPRSSSTREGERDGGRERHVGLIGTELEGIRQEEEDTQLAELRTTCRDKRRSPVVGSHLEEDNLLVAEDNRLVGSHLEEDNLLVVEDNRLEDNLLAVVGNLVVVVVGSLPKLVAVAVVVVVVVAYPMASHGFGPSLRQQLVVEAMRSQA